MDIYITYGGIFLILLVLELAYFKVADRFNIIDKPKSTPLIALRNIISPECSCTWMFSKLGRL